MNEDTSDPRSTTGAAAFGQRVRVWVIRARLVGCGLAVVLMACSMSPAQSSSSWQLTFSYQPEGVVLETAALMPAPAKAISSPGAGGAPLTLAYRLDWLDSAGNTLLDTLVEIPLGERIVPGLGGDPASHDSRVPESGVFVLRVDGASKIGDAAGVRLVYRGVTATSTLLPSAVPPGIPEAFAESEIVFVLPAVPSLVTADYEPGPLRVTKRRDTGPDENRLVLVIMGDGYTGPELDAGDFSSQVNRFLARLFSTSPWDACAGVVNVYQVDLVSSESGADYEDAAPDAGGTLRDTYLDAHFWAGGIERSLALSGDGVLRAFAAADSMVGVGIWDEVLVLVNSGKYGGNGGAVSVSSTHPSADEIQVHELGHSVANLADEYETGLTSTNCVGGILSNLDCGVDFPHVKWDVWVEAGTPMPTPETAEYEGVVGAFEGGYYQTVGIYRPMLDCKMRTLGVPFCVVCREALVLELFDRIRLLDSVSPAPGPVELPSSTERVFEVAAVPFAGITYQWWLNGIELPDATGSSLTLAGQDLVGPDHELRLTVTYPTPLVRARAIETNVVWQLAVVDLPTFTLSGASVVEGDTGATELLLTASLLAPYPAPVTVNYATVDGTAAAGSDYVAVAGQFAFDALETTQTLSVSIVGDLAAESQETLFIDLTVPQNTILESNRVTIVIEGNNVLAVELHLASDTSPAATFASSLEAVIMPDPIITGQPESQLANEGADVTLTVTAVGRPSMTYQWIFGGSNPIPWATNRTLVLTNVQDTHAGTYSVIVRDGGTAVSSNAVLMVNHLPMVPTPVLERFPAQAVKSAVAYFLGTDPDGDPLTLSSAGPASTQGGNVSVLGSWVLYVPPAGYDGPDSFPFSLSDGRGGISTGTATVIVSADTAFSLDIRAKALANGSVWLRCDGIPGRTYQIQFTETLMPPDWRPLTTLAADPNGAFDHVDRPPTGAPQRYYRVVHP